MISQIRKISRAGEIAIVLTVAFGMFILGSLTVFLAEPGTVDDAIKTDGLISIIAFELVVFALLLPFLRLRGWTWTAIGLRPTIRQTLTGFGIAVLAMLCQALVVTALGVNESAVKTDFQSGPIPWTTFAALSIINPLYEEIFVCGYLISAVMEKRGARVAILSSAMLRGVYHLYQGAFSATLIGLLGIGFGAYYARSGKLWPIVVAHGLLDFTALAALAMAAQQ